VHLPKIKYKYSEISVPLGDSVALLELVDEIKKEVDSRVDPIIDKVLKQRDHREATHKGLE